MMDNTQYNIPWQEMDTINFGGVYISKQAQFQMKSNMSYHLQGNKTIIYFETGNGLYWLDEKEKKEYKAGSMIILKKEVKLWLESNKVSNCYFMELVHVDDWFRYMLAKKTYLYLLVNERIIGQFDLLWKYVTGNMQNDQYGLSKELYQLLMSFDEFSRIKEKKFTPLVQGILDLIQEEYAFLEGMDEVADVMGCSKSHLIRVFKKEVGESPGQYLQQTRLGNAVLLLKSEAFTIEVIANMVGYSCSNYFCKVFQKQFGESPGAYRKRNSSQLKRTEKESIRKILNVYQV